jgi:hypothetical protein
MAERRRHLPLSLVLYGGVGVKTPELERRFFGKLRLPNGTQKTTYERRLDDLNDMVLPFLPRGRSARVMDVAVSSGISTLEWSEHLDTHGIRHTMVAGDLCIEGWLTSWGTAVAIVFDDTQQNPLLLEVGPLLLPLRSDRWLARAVRPLLFPALRAVARIAQRIGHAAPMAPADHWRLVHRQIALVSPRLRGRRAITIVQDDISVPGRFSGAFDAIRVANLLHRAYFDDDALELMVRNLQSRLKDAGILAICRTMEDGSNQATVFRLKDGRFVVEGSLNDGAEISRLVLECAGSPG